MKQQSNISYFALYSETANTPLLTVHKSKRARIAIKYNIRVSNNANVRLTGYVRVYPSKNEDKIEAQHFDSGTQKTVKQLMVKNKKNQI